VDDGKIASFLVVFYAAFILDQKFDLQFDQNDVIISFFLSVKLCVYASCSCSLLDKRKEGIDCYCLGISG